MRIVQTAQTKEASTQTKEASTQTKEASTQTKEASTQAEGSHVYEAATSSHAIEQYIDSAVKKYIENGTFHADTITAKNITADNIVVNDKLVVGDENGRLNVTITTQKGDAYVTINGGNLALNSNEIIDAGAIIADGPIESFVRVEAPEIVGENIAAYTQDEKTGEMRCVDLSNHKHTIAQGSDETGAPIPTPVQEADSMTQDFILHFDI